MGEGTVFIWQHETGYHLFPLSEPLSLPSRAQGVFVILSGLTVVMADVIDQVYSPTKAIERAVARPDVKPHAPTHTAFLGVRTWNDALDEFRRLHAFYRPKVPARVR